jgi:hypothetical protein
MEVLEASYPRKGFKNAVVPLLPPSRRQKHRQIRAANEGNKLLMVIADRVNRSTVVGMLFSIVS